MDYNAESGFSQAVKARTDAIVRLAIALAGGGSQLPDLELISNRLEIVHGLIFNLDRKVDAMSSSIDRIEKEAADAAENVNLVRTAMEGLKTISDGMKAEITALKEQIAQGQIDQARLEAAASTFEKADDDIDAIVLPPAPEGGETPTPET